MTAMRGMSLGMFHVVLETNRWQTIKVTMVEITKKLLTMKYRNLNVAKRRWATGRGNEEEISKKAPILFNIKILQ